LAGKIERPNPVRLQLSGIFRGEHSDDLQHIETGVAALSEFRMHPVLRAEQVERLDKRIAYYRRWQTNCERDVGDRLFSGGGGGA
jgi:hypothetical protein